MELSDLGLAGSTTVMLAGNTTLTGAFTIGVDLGEGFVRFEDAITVGANFSASGIVFDDATLDGVPFAIVGGAVDFMAGARLYVDNPDQDAEGKLTLTELQSPAVEARSGGDLNVSLPTNLGEWGPFQVDPEQLAALLVNIRDRDPFDGEAAVTSFDVTLGEQARGLILDALAALDSVGESIADSPIFSTDLPIVERSLNHLLNSGLDETNWGDLIRFGPEVLEYFNTQTGAGRLPTLSGITDIVVGRILQTTALTFDTDNRAAPVFDISGGLDSDTSEIRVEVDFLGGYQTGVANILLDSLGPAWTDLGLRFSGGLDLDLSVNLDLGFSFGIGFPSGTSADGFFLLDQFQIDAALNGDGSSLGFEVGPIRGDVEATRLRLGTGVQVGILGDGSAEFSLTSPLEGERMLDVELGLSAGLFGKQFNLPDPISITDQDLFDDTVTAFDANLGDLVNFGSFDVEQVLNVLVVAGNFLDQYRDSAVFDIAIPFVDADLGDVFDFGRALSETVTDVIQTQARTAGLDGIFDTLDDFLELPDHIVVTPAYDADANEITIGLLFDFAFPVLQDAAFDVDFDLGDLAGLAASGSLSITADARIGLTLGIDLDPEPRQMEISRKVKDSNDDGDLDAEDFTLHADATFLVQIEDEESVQLVVRADDTAIDGTLDGLVAAINHAIGVTALAGRLSALADDDTIVYRTIETAESMTISVPVNAEQAQLGVGDGIEGSRGEETDPLSLETVVQDKNDDGELTAEDFRLDADATIHVQVDDASPVALVIAAVGTSTNETLQDLVDDINQAIDDNDDLRDTLIAEAVGSDTIRYRTSSADVADSLVVSGDAAGWQLGLVDGLEATQPRFEGFIEDLTAAGGLSLGIGDEFSIVGSFGNLLEIGLHEISGTITDAGGAPMALSGELGVTVLDPDEGDTRLTLRELLRLGGDLVDGDVAARDAFDLALSGSAGLSLGGIELQPALVSVPAETAIEIGGTFVIDDLLGGKAPAFNVDSSGLSSLVGGLKELSFDQIVAGLNTVVKFLAGDPDNPDDWQEAFGFLNTELPLIDMSVSELFDIAAGFSAAVGEFGASEDDGQPSSLRLVETGLETLLGLSDDDLALSLETDGAGDPDALKFELTYKPFEQLFGDSFAADLSFKLDMESLIEHVPAEVRPLVEGLANLVDVRAEATLTFLADLTLQLDFGVGLDDLVPFLYDTTGVTIDLRLDGDDLEFQASLGPISLGVVGGRAVIDGDGEFGGNIAADALRFEFGLVTDADDGRYLPDELLVNLPNIVEASVQGKAHASLPIGSLSPEFDILVDLEKLLGGEDGAVEITTPDLSSLLNVSLLEILADPAILVDGLDAALGGLQAALDIGTALRLPLIGDVLGDASGFIGDFREGMLDKIKKALPASTEDPDSGLPGLLKDKLNELFGDQGQGLDLLMHDIGLVYLDAEGNPVNTVGEAAAIQFDLHLGDELSLTIDPELQFDLGLDALDLGFAVTDGAIVVSAGWEILLGFGITADGGLYLVTEHPDHPDQAEVQLTVDVAAPGLTAEGKLFFLQALASVPDDAGPMVEGAITIDLVDPGTHLDDGRLMITGGELSGDVIQADVGLTTDVKLDLELGINAGEGTSYFPRILTQLQLFGEWGELTGRFDNVRIDLGAFFSDFVKPIVDKISVVLDPIRTVFAALDAPIPGISDIAGQDISLLDLPQFLEDAVSGSSLDINLPGLHLSLPRFYVEGLAGFLTQFTQIADLVNQVGLIIDLIDDSNETIVLPMGSYTFLVPGGGEPYSEDPDAADLNPSIQAFLDSQQPGDTDRDGDSGARKSRLRFPFLGEPSQIFGLLMGKDIDLMVYDVPDIAIDIGIELGLTIPPPGIPLLDWLPTLVDISFRGDFLFKTNFDFGFDTNGIRRFIAEVDAGTVDPEDFLLPFDGFYIADAPGLELELAFGLGIEVAGNLGVVRGGGGGSIDFHGYIDLADPNDDGKFRVSEMAAVMVEDLNPLDLFNIDIGLSASAHVSIEWWNPFRVKYKRVCIRWIGCASVPYPSPGWQEAWSADWSGEIFSLQWGEDPNAEPATPRLATLGGDGELRLNMGPDADARAIGNSTDGDEHFKVSQSGNVTTVKAFLDGKWAEQTFDNVARIVADGGEGNDTLEFDDVVIPVVMRGGGGNDTLIARGLSGALQIDGGAGNDVITLERATGTVTVQGGSGADEITVQEGTAVLYVNGGADHDQIALEGVLASRSGTRAVLLGGAGNDSLIADEATTAPLRVDAGAGNDTLRGGRGNDELVGGGGDDLYLFGESIGQDTVVDSSGVDTLDFTAVAESIEFTLNAGFVAAYDAGNSVTEGGRAIEKILGGTAGDTFAVSRTGSAGVTLDGKGGNDRFDVQFADPSLPPPTLKVSIVGSEDHDTLAARGTQGADTVTVDENSVEAAFGGGAVQRATFNGVENLEVSLLAGADSLTLTGTAVPLLALTGEDEDTINVGSLAPLTGGILAPIGALLSIHGGDGVDIVNVDNSGDTDGATGVLTASMLTGLGMAAGIGYEAVENLNLDLGTGNDQLDVRSTSATTRVQANDGADTVNVGSALHASGQNVNEIDALLHILGGDGYDVVYVDDSGDGSDNTGELTATMVTGLGMGVGILYEAVDELNIDLGSGNDEFNVRGTSTATHLRTHAGSDTVNVGSLSPAIGGTVHDIQGPLYVYGGGDGDELNVDDRGDTADETGTLTPSRLIGLGMGAGILYEAVDVLNIDLGSGDEVFNVRGTSAETHLFTHDGDERIYVSSEAALGQSSWADFLRGHLDHVGGALNIHAGTGHHLLMVSDEAATVADTDVLISGSLIHGLAPADITYAADDPGGDFAGGITIWTGSGGDIVSVNGSAQSPGVETITALNTGGGADEVTIAVTAGGLFVLNTEEGDDQVDASESTLPLLIFGGGGADTIRGGGNGDIILGDSGRVHYLTEGGETTSVLGGGGPGDRTDGIVRQTALVFTMASSDAGADTVWGGDGVDLVLGGAAGDELHGEAGDDIMVGDGGILMLSGGLAVRVQTTDSELSGENEMFGRPLVAVTATGGAMRSGGMGTLNGTSVMAGGARPLDPVPGGADTMFGGGGEDVLAGGVGGDSIDGDEGDDLIIGDDVLLDRAGRLGVTENPRFRALIGDRIYGDDGKDRVDRESMFDNPGGIPVWADWKIELLDSSPTDEIADPTGFNSDYLAGGANDDMIFGQAGDDTIQGDGSIAGKLEGTPVAAHREADGTLTVVPSFGSVADGDDYIEGNGGADTIFGNLGQDDIIGGSSDQFGLVTRGSRQDGADLIFGGAGTEIGRADAGDTSNEGHARDADMILGDNGNIFRLVGSNGANSGGYLTFSYDNYSGTLRIVPRAAQLLDYTPGGSDVDPAAATTDIGGADEIHGESGDDVIYGMLGPDLLFGEGQDDDIIGGYGSDWIAAGAGDDGVLGDDGRIYTSRNDTIDEPLYGIAGYLPNELDQLIRTPGNKQVATINVTGELKKTVNLEPYFVALAGRPFNPYHDPADADDVIYGGFGMDFLHGGSGDDAISGAEALATFYAAPGNPGDLLGYGADPARPNEFAAYDEYDPWAKIPDFLLNFNEQEGLLVDGAAPKPVYSDGDDRIFGDLGNDWIVGGTGQDRLYGGWGDDLLNADDDHDSTEGTGDPLGNDVPDSHATYADIAYGGAGRDVLIANSAGDRLIDWVGQFNSYVVPFASNGSPTISRGMNSKLPGFLLDLSEGDGADPTRAADAGTDPDRNGEPLGELGMVRQHDTWWGDQTGGPHGSEQGNIPGQHRDVLGSADFDGPQPSVGVMTESGIGSTMRGRYVIMPDAPGETAISLVDLDVFLPRYIEFQATINAGLAKPGFGSNGYLVFDFQDLRDFKFAGIDAGANKLIIGHRDSHGWQVDAEMDVVLQAGRGYALDLELNDDVVTAVLEGTYQVEFTFQRRLVAGESYGVTSGMVGMGSDGSVARFDNLQMLALPRPIVLDYEDGFENGAADMFQGIRTGEWTIADGRYIAVPAQGETTAISSIDLELEHGLNQASMLELEATLSTQSRGGFVFDQHSTRDFKFVAIDAEGRQVLIGHHTDDGGWVVDHATSTAINAGEDYELSVKLRGCNVRVDLNGLTVAQYDYTALVLDGDFGLFSVDGETSIDSLQVRSDDPALMEPGPGHPYPVTADSGPAIDDETTPVDVFAALNDGGTSEDILSAEDSDDVTYADTDAWDGSMISSWYRELFDRGDPWKVDKDDRTTERLEESALPLDWVIELERPAKGVGERTDNEAAGHDARPGVDLEMIDRAQAAGLEAEWVVENQSRRMSRRND